MRLQATLIALVCTTLSSISWAQTQAADAPPATDADGSIAASPSPEQKEEAADRFRRGIRFYEGGDYGLALIEFERAYQLVPNFRVLYNVGQVSIQLGRFARARSALEQYVSEGGEGLKMSRRAAVLRDLEMLKARTAELLIESNVSGAELLIDGVPSGRTPFAEPLLLDAGEHTIELRRAGYTPLTRRLTLAGADETSLSLSLEKVKDSVVVIREKAKPSSDEPKPKPGPSVAKAPEPTVSPWVYAGWGGSALLAGGAVVMAILGNAKANSAEEIESSPDPSLSDHQAATSAAKTRFLVADVLAASAVLTGGASLYFTLMPSSKEHGSGSVSLKMSPSSLMLSGDF